MSLKNNNDIGKTNLDEEMGKVNLLLMGSVSWNEGYSATADLVVLHPTFYTYDAEA